MTRFLRLLENGFRHLVVYPVLRLFLHNPPVSIPIDIKRVRKILILRYDRIGDIVVTTPMFRILKKAHPELFIGVLASQSNADMIRHDPLVDRIHILPSRWTSLPRMIGEAKAEQYDLLLNFIFNRTTSGGVLANLIAPKGVKVGQGAEKYRFYFNVLLQLPRGSMHMAEVLGHIVTEVFDIPVTKRDLRFRISLDEASRRSVSGYFSREKKVPRKGKKTGNRYVVLNISATDAVRKLSEEQALFLARILSVDLGFRTIVVASPQDAEWRERLVDHVKSPLCSSFPRSGHAGILEITALIEGGEAVVTPDTSVVHLSSAVATPVLGIFSPLQVTAEWLPYQVRHKIVLAPAGEPVSAIALTTLESELRSFLKAITQ